MPQLVSYAACGVVSYLLGAVPFGYLIGRARGVDVRAVGSGNIGATNVFRTVGKPWGILTFFLDALKGFAGAWAVPRLVCLFAAPDNPEAAAVLGACLAVVGHNWPVYMRFRGGKGVATSAGALLGIAPLAVAAAAVIWIALFATTRFVSVASIGAAVALPVAAWWTRGESALTPWALTGLGILAVWRHKGNIERLLRGTEHRFEFGRGRKPTG